MGLRARLVRRLLVLVGCLVASQAWAERPPPRDRAPAEFFTELKGAEDTPGARFLATLPEKVMMLGKPNSATCGIIFSKPCINLS